MQQLVLIVNLQCTTCNITKKETAVGCATAGHRAVTCFADRNSSSGNTKCRSRYWPMRDVKSHFAIAAPSVSRRSTQRASNPTSGTVEERKDVSLAASTQRGARKPEVGDSSRADSPGTYAIRPSRRDNRKEETTDWPAKGAS